MSDQRTDALNAPNEVSVRGVVWGGVAIAVSIALVVVAAWLLWHWWGAPSGAPPHGARNTGTVSQAPSPALQSSPRQERAQYEAEKRKLLESWQWIDQQHGIARIPIEEAMRIIAGQTQSQSQSEDPRKGQDQSVQPPDVRKEPR
ncbi:hypothetical protein ACFQ3P_37835 [Paraburkholderia sabiae]|uniref:Uncharacterized protein n=1 Tax=Paraburkholderia sabiae TaxID=273251 RepID=A0ABU9QM24_9BURK|nr:hypothetical protein [Paraburkholderia sabiae]WJZ79951.1 hypothetical protein QEN71_43135 [Paraburkholderia sabiae]CAD6561294.1 hypothetical protein LMG24235_07254 [Paraburkholderia sabiae]